MTVTSQSLFVLASLIFLAHNSAPAPGKLAEDVDLLIIEAVPQAIAWGSRGNNVRQRDADKANNAKARKAEQSWPVRLIRWKAGEAVPTRCAGSMTNPDLSTQLSKEGQVFVWKRAPCYRIATQQYVESRLAEALPTFLDAARTDSSSLFAEQVAKLREQNANLSRRLDSLEAVLSHR